MRVFASRDLRQRLPCLYCNMTVGFGREREDHFSGVDSAVKARSSVTHAGFSYRARDVREFAHFVRAVPVDTLAAVALRIEQEPHRRELAIDILVIALDNRHGRCCLAGDKVALTRPPILRFEWLAKLARGIVH